MPFQVSQSLLNASRSRLSSYLQKKRNQIHPSSAHRTNYSPLRPHTTSKLSYPNKKPRRASNAVVIPGLSALPDSQPPYANTVNPFPMAIESIENEPEAQYSRAAPPHNGFRYASVQPQHSSSAGGYGSYGDNATNYGTTYGSPRVDPYYNPPNQYTPSNALPSDQSYYMRQMPSSPHGMAYGAYNSSKWTPSNSNTYQSPSQQPMMPLMNPQLAMSGTQAPFPFMPFPPMPSIQGARSMSSFAGPPIEPPQILQPSFQPERQRSMTPPMRVPSASEQYMKQAQQQPEKTKKRPLLIILDLNGTLIFRKRRKFPPVFVERAGLREFLDELCKNHSVMVWTSSKPETCQAIVSTLFPTTGKKKKQKLVACWGRDKFGLSKRQYNAKLQVYKELHKVWNTPDIQREYPSKQAKTAAAHAPKPKGVKGGKFAKNKQQKEVEIEFPEGHRWDQTNTILIDDSKIKALSEPYNILEIPEFTNDPNIDESTLFRRVLVTLDALSHHDDVSKVFRVWEERQIQQNCKVLDLDISPELPPAFEDLDSSDDGGAKLPQTEPSVSSQAQKPAKPPRNKHAEKRERKKEKKRLHKKQALAAEPAAMQEESNGVPSTLGAPPEPVSAPAPASASAPTSAPAPAPAAQPTPTDPNPNATRTPEEIQEARTATRKAAKGRKRARKAQRRADEQMKKELGSDADNEIIQEKPDKSRYMLRSQHPKPSARSVPEHGSNPIISSTDDEHWSAVHSAVEQSPIIPIDSRRRSISPATSDGSRNSLLDRLEDGLGLRNSR